MFENWNKHDLKDGGGKKVVAIGYGVHRQHHRQEATQDKPVDNSIFSDPRKLNDRRIDDSPLSRPSPDRRRINRRKMACIDESWWIYRRYTPSNYSSL